MPARDDQIKEQSENGVRQIKLTLGDGGLVRTDLAKTDNQPETSEPTSNRTASVDHPITPDASNRSHSNAYTSTAHKTARRKPIAGIGLSKSGHLTLADQRKLGARIYRLKSYTTVGKINRKFTQDKQQRLLRNVLAFVLLIVVLVILIVVYNPIQDVVDFRKMLGLDSPFMSIPTMSETVPSELPTIP